MTKKDSFLNIIKTELEKEKILVAMWSEADSNSGYLIRQDGECLGIGEYQEDNANIQDLNQDELGQIAINATSLNDFLKLGHWQIQANQIKWIYEIEENKNFTINGKIYEFDEDIKAGEFYYSGMKKESFKQEFILNKDIFYIDDKGEKLEIKSGSAILGFENDTDKNNVLIYLYVKDKWAVEIKSEYTDYKSSKTREIDVSQSSVNRCQFKLKK